MADRDADIHLGDHTARAELLVAGGNFESIEHVVEAALDALDRQQCVFDDQLRAKVAEALNDPRPPLPMDEAMRDVWRRIEANRIER